MKKVILYAGFLLVWFFQLGFTTDAHLELPLKKIDKGVDKIWKTTDFDLVKIAGTGCDENGCWYQVISQDEEIGLVYNGRVNSCRSGGCALSADDQAIAFEFFDYLLFTDPEGSVLWVKIYNYQATQGHEVMSRGWLNQFKGTTPEAALDFGRDIEAISGATVSAKAITDNIQQVLACAF